MCVRISPSFCDYHGTLPCVSGLTPRVRISARQIRSERGGNWIVLNSRTCAGTGVGVAGTTAGGTVLSVACGHDHGLRDLRQRRVSEAHHVYSRCSGTILTDNLQSARMID